MIPLPLDQLAGILSAQIRGGDPQSRCTGVSIDTRSQHPGDLYVAIRGERLDGHQFVSQALDRGAVGCLVDHALPVNGPQLIVTDTLTALSDWARWSRQQASYRLIGITGSVGKTTTRCMIGHVLGRQHPCWQSPKNFNNHIGLPLTLLSAPDDATFVVAELGTSAPGEIGPLSRIAAPDIAVVTCTAPAHLEGFGSLEAIVTEKLSIREGLNEGSPLILNADCDSLMRGARHRHLEFRTYGLTAGTDVRGSEVTMTAQGSTFTVEGQRVFIPIPGPGNVQNALACWTVCRSLGMGPDVIRDALATLPPVTMRSECIELGDMTILNDCYNANPASMVNALQTLAQLDPEHQRRRVFICGAMAELGAGAEQLHRELGPAIATAEIDTLLAVGSLPALSAQAAQTLRPNMGFCRYEDVNELCLSLTDEIQEQDLILVKGSRSAQLEKVVATIQEQRAANQPPINRNPASSAASP